MSTPNVRPLALITGAAKRIGRSIALTLVKRGCDVVFTYNSSREQAEQTLEELIALGADKRVSQAMPLDLANSAAIERFCREVKTTHKKLDLLIHNASSYEQTPLSGITAEQAIAAYQVNAVAPLLLSAGLSELLERGHAPAIVSLCDIHAMGEHSLPRAKNFLAYAMSKAALAEMVRGLARELAPKVRVNGVAFGVAAWPDQGHESDQIAQQAYIQKIPLARAGTPEEAAEVVTWLGLDATYLTGQIVRMDGGRSLI